MQDDMSPRRSLVARVSSRTQQAPSPDAARHGGMCVMGAEDDDAALRTGTSGSGSLASPRSVGLVQALRKQLAERELALHSSQELVEAMHRQEEKAQTVLCQTRQHASALGVQLEDKLRMLHEAAMRQEALEKELGAAQQRVEQVEQRLALAPPLSTCPPQHQVSKSAGASTHTLACARACTQVVLKCSCSMHKEQTYTDAQTFYRPAHNQASRPAHELLVLTKTQRRGTPQVTQGRTVTRGPIAR